jgi:hypothetical protein
MFLSRRVAFLGEANSVISLAGRAGGRQSPHKDRGCFRPAQVRPDSCGYPQLEYGHMALNQQPQQLYLSPFGHCVLVGIQENYPGTEYIWR